MEARCITRAARARSRSSSILADSIPRRVRRPNQNIACANRAAPLESTNSQSCRASEPN